MRECKKLVKCEWIHNVLSIKCTVVSTYKTQRFAHRTLKLHTETCVIECAMTNSFGQGTFISQENVEIIASCVGHVIAN